ncbi:hypothetical protein L228DRAFT_30082 [Xylona heveae TC161]|uniref:Uncharacterized protein n=1 Tax=Xylona heveae (strain CBS 132557 / TC161) TaxID=1328760 RepID=A0A165A1P1_XYLHT|nr:hypothetical protein L228DRAFT_30082 [Xylona heveae TC161]KZF19830.1 hypothetical protein L228DRAFT_30082 [Xylona heveae TC161]
MGPEFFGLVLVVIYTGSTGTSLGASLVILETVRVIRTCFDPPSACPPSTVTNDSGTLSTMFSANDTEYLCTHVKCSCPVCHMPGLSNQSGMSNFI